MESGGVAIRRLWKNHSGELSVLWMIDRCDFKAALPRGPTMRILRNTLRSWNSRWTLGLGRLARINISLHLWFCLMTCRSYLLSRKKRTVCKNDLISKSSRPELHFSFFICDIAIDQEIDWTTTDPWDDATTLVSYSSVDINGCHNMSGDIEADMLSCLDYIRNSSKFKPPPEWAIVLTTAVSALKSQVALKANS